MKKLIKWLKASTILTAFCGLLSIGCLLNDQAKHKVESVSALSVLDYSSNTGTISKTMSGNTYSGTFDAKIKKYYDGSNQYYKYYLSINMYDSFTYNSSTYKLGANSINFSNYSIELYSESFTGDFQNASENLNLFLGLQVGQVVQVGFPSSFGIKLTILAYLNYGTTYEQQSVEVTTRAFDSSNNNVNNATTLNDMLNSIYLFYGTNTTQNRLLNTSLSTSPSETVTIYDDAYTQGNIDGLEQGQAQGYNQGYDVGYSDGVASQESAITSAYNDGYSTGYNEASSVNTTVATIFSGILQVAMVPVNFFLAIFNFEILGINLSAFIKGIFTIALTIIVIRTIFGGKGASDS